MNQGFALAVAGFLLGVTSSTPGCLYLTCESFTPVNLEWHQPGAFDEMPSEGEYAGFQVQWRTHEKGFTRESKVADRDTPSPEILLNVHENDTVSLLAIYDERVTDDEFYDDLRSAFADLGLSSPIAADERLEPEWRPELCD